MTKLLSLSKIEYTYVISLIVIMIALAVKIMHYGYDLMHVVS